MIVYMSVKIKACKIKMLKGVGRPTFFHINVYLHSSTKAKSHVQVFQPDQRKMRE